MYIMMFFTPIDDVFIPIDHVFTPIDNVFTPFDDVFHTYALYFPHLSMMIYPPIMLRETQMTVGVIYFVSKMFRGTQVTTRLIHFKF